MDNNLQFDVEQTERIRKIARYHNVTKELLLFGEQADPENRTLLQPINELRNCLDHLVRVILYKLGEHRPTEQNNYVTANLDKSYGHVYRAAYDTLDWVSITLKGRILTEMDGFSNETIQAVMPEYYSEIRPRLEELLNNDIVELRMDKDVTAKDEANIVKYGEIAAELKDLFKRIISKKPALVEHHTRKQESEKRGKGQRIREGLVIGIICIIVGWGISLF